jgi:threonylcarbamoyladenosine tRNA methylthiotransferase MtaB
MSAEKVRAIPGVDIVAGTKDHEELAAKIERLIFGGTSIRDAGGIGDRAERARAREYLKIQDGCDNYCSYCVIPYTRGLPRGRDVRGIIADMSGFLERGVTETILTGINISSYQFFHDGEVTGLGGLINVVSDEMRRANERSDRLARLRLSSVEPTVVTEEFADVLAANADIVCPHFHISLQSGSDSVLRRMNRKYAVDGYRLVLDRLRAYFPDAGFTTDVIVGFPGESDAEFMETASFCREAAFSALHVFPYSRRSGTPAADMPGQVESGVKRERVRRMLALSKELSFNFNKKYVGETVNILIEQIDEGTGMAEIAESVPRAVYGLTGNYIYVTAGIDAAEIAHQNQIGSYVSVRVNGASHSQLTGIIVGQPRPSRI